MHPSGTNNLCFWRLTAQQGALVIGISELFALTTFFLLNGMIWNYLAWSGNYGFHTNGEKIIGGNSVYVNQEEVLIHFNSAKWYGPSILGMLIQTCLVIGAGKGIRWLLMPWMIVGCLRAAGFIVVAFSLFLIFHLGPRSNVFGMLLLILLMGETIYCLVVVFRCYNELGVVRPQISIAVTYQNQPQPPIYGQVYPNYPTPTPFNSQQK